MRIFCCVDARHQAVWVRTNGDPGKLEDAGLEIIEDQTSDWDSGDYEGTVTLAELKRLPDFVPYD